MKRGPGMKSGIIAVVGLILWTGCSAPHPETSAEKKDRAPVRVTIASAESGSRARSERLPGTVRAVKTAPLASKLTGTVLEVRVKPGDRVKSGQLLARIDSREAEAMLRKARAGKQEAEMAIEEIDRNIAAARSNLELSQATLKRYRKLQESKAVTPQEFEEVETRERAAAETVAALEARKQQIHAKVAQAQSDGSTAEALSSYAELRSPFDGVVTLKQMDVGSLAVPGMPLLTVEETSRYRLEVPIEESRLAATRVGQKVQVRVAAIKEEPMEGTIREIEAAADPASRTYLVKIDLPTKGLFRSGMYGEAWFPGETVEGIWIQNRGVVRRGQIDGAYVVEEGQVARLRLLKLGAATGSEVEVQAGLQGGERYVLAPSRELEDGSQVEVVP
ncbi:MAG: efflux RND transporter periplasmic adaptor subunit [Acidobacteriota bacterium]